MVRQDALLMACMLTALATVQASRTGPNRSLLAFPSWACWFGGCPPAQPEPQGTSPPSVVDILVRVREELGNPSPLSNWTNHPRSGRDAVKPNPCDGTWRGIICQDGAVVGIELGWPPTVPLDHQPDPALDAEPDPEGDARLSAYLATVREDPPAQFKLPRSLGLLTTLTSINLRHRNTTGTHEWEAWSTLTRLTSLHMDNNRLSGSLPPSWSTLTRLASLRLYSNQLTGTLPPSWSTLTALTGLEVMNNRLEGTLPQSWSTLDQLQVLRLGDNPGLTGTLPSQWSGMTSMWILSLTDMPGLSGPLPDSWAAMTKLHSMHLWGNRLSGTLPASWSTLTHLWEMLLEGNRLTGSLPSSWQALTPRLFHLSGNALSGTLPVAWGEGRMAEELTALHLEGNALTGTLPASWSRMVKIWDLDLSRNRLSGELPEAWYGIGRSEDTVTQGATWNLSNNQLTGQLPASWALLPVFHLDLSNNRIQGTLPPSWGVTWMQDLDLSGNLIGGSLPESWGGLQYASTLALSRNRLAGSVPASWGRLMDRLIYMNVSHNPDMCGTVPRTVLGGERHPVPSETLRKAPATEGTGLFKPCPT